MRPLSVSNFQLQFSKLRPSNLRPIHEIHDENTGPHGVGHEFLDYSNVPHGVGHEIFDTIIDHIAWGTNSSTKVGRMAWGTKSPTKMSGCMAWGTKLTLEGFGGLEVES